jgi:hypothetical protein
VSGDLRIAHDEGEAIPIAADDEGQRARASDSEKRFSRGIQASDGAAIDLDEHVADLEP